MKRLFIVFGIVVFVLLILIITKPSKERCKNEFKSTMIILTSTDFIKYQDNNSSKIASVKLQNRLDAMEEEASEKFSKEHWEDYYSYNDYLIFCTIKFKGLVLNKKIGMGILNSTFKYK